IYWHLPGFSVFRDLNYTVIELMREFPNSFNENYRAKAMLEEAGVTLMADGLVRGMSGVGLFQSRIDGLDAMCLIAPANPQLPDPRAAASTLLPLSKIIPRFEVDPQPLIQEAKEIEDRLRSQQANQQPINHNIYG
ncbi:MAG: PAC2 family protein, partial [Candidatus Methanomethylophilus sp.]|nr:PAC2 family protein [Methanomethylophilus sp.]